VITGPPVYELLVAHVGWIVALLPFSLISQSPHKMASRFETPVPRLRRFEHARAKLSDGLVGIVLPRASRWHSANLASDAERAASPLPKLGRQSYSAYDNSGEATTALLSLTEDQARIASKKRSRDDSPTPPDRGDPDLNRLKSEVRREQCRTNQARYRNQQRNMQLQLETSVKQLRQELEHLKCQRQNVLLAEKTDQSPWTIVAEVFRIVQKSLNSPWNLEHDEDMQNDSETGRSVEFLQTAFTSDVAMGDVRGVDALMKQWRHYSLQFGDSRLRLQRVEEVSPSVMTAQARLHVKVSELVLRHAFPHLSDSEPTSKYDVHPCLRERLLGQHLSCSVSVDFLFDSENGRVARLEPRIDLIPALFRALGNVEDVAEACYGDTNSVEP
jgi:hypothetical protein